MAEVENCTRHTRRQKIHTAIAALMGSLTIAGFVFVLFFGPSHGEADYLKLMITEIGMLFSTILYICSCLSVREDAGQGHTFTAVSALSFAAILLTGICDVMDGMAEAGSLLVALQTVAALCSLRLHILFWNYQCASLPEKHKRRHYTVVIYAIVLIYLILLIINLFTGFLFHTDATGRMIYNGGSIDIVITVAFYVIYLLYILPQHCPWKKKLSVASFAIFPLLLVLFIIIWYAVGITYNASAVMYIFLLLATYVVFFGDYIESKELLLRQKAELAEMKSELMLSQLNPHFVANTLNSIVALCRFDPPEAERATRLFAGYLRENYVDMSGNQMIPFDRELQNLKNYIAIEQIRFPDLQVGYDISCTKFTIPTMTMQPLAENAITHGVHGKGRITVSTAETQSGYIVRIADNGVGFTEPPEDGRVHLGIANCRERLQTLCLGSLTIKSRDGGGTVCEILIPKEKKANEDTVH